MMFGIFAGFDEFLESPERKKERLREEKERLERRLENCVDWTDDIKWEHQLNIRAKSYKPKKLFKVRVSQNHPNKEKRKDCFEISPSGRYCYYERSLPRGTSLWTARGKTQGSVVFDGRVRIPSLFERRYADDDEIVWRKRPWMSSTPMEFLSLRCGTRFAKGTVVIGGLGMGYQLEKVAERKKVKKIILVEHSQELVDWILPRLDLNGHEVEVVVGDARKLIPEMEADAALIDIYPGYGGNCFPKCPNINKVWVWGSQYVA